MNWPPPPEPQGTADSLATPDLRALSTRGMVGRAWPLLRYLPNAQFRDLGQGAYFAGFGPPGPSFNCAAVIPTVFPAADGAAEVATCPSLPEVLALVAQQLMPVPTGYGILVEGDCGHPLESALRAAGCQVAETEPLLAWEHHRPPRPQPDLLTRDGRRVRGAETPEDLKWFTALTTEIFQAPLELAEALTPHASCLSDPNLTFLFVWDRNQPENDRPVGSVGACQVPEGTILFGLAVLPDYRRRGHATALTHATALWGLQHHQSPRTLLRANPDSFPLYRAIGFRHLANHCIYVPNE